MSLPSPDRLIAIAETLRIAIAVATTLLLLGGLALHWRRRASLAHRTRDGLLATLALLTVFVWWFPRQGSFGVWFHPFDAFHYYIGGKYFRELGYTRIYECSVRADVEAGYGTLVSRSTIRDLETNRLQSAQPLVTQPDRCKPHFSEARWRDFTRDVAWFRRGLPFESWLQIRTDHGYNAPPVWGLLGTPLASTAPASARQLRWLTMIDPLLLAIMLGSVAWAFGWRTMCIALIFWGTNQPARWEWVGGSILRYDWLALSVGGLCCLRRERPAAAGVLLAYATCLRIFPGMIAASLALTALIRLARERSLQPTGAQRRFGLAFAGTALLLVGLSSASAGGVHIWRDFVENSRRHFDTATENRVGLRPLLSYDHDKRAAVTVDPSQIDPYGEWREARRETFARREPVYAVLALGFAVLLAIAASRQPDWVTAILGVGLIPVVLELGSYYYAILLAFALLWTRWPSIGVGLMLLSTATWLLRCRESNCDEASAWSSFAILVFVSFATLRVLRGPARAPRPAPW